MMNEIDQTKFRLDLIKRIENYFHEEIYQRKLCNKKLSKYVAAINYIEKILIVLTETTGGICIISHASVVGAPIGIAGAGFTVLFSLVTATTKILLKTTKNKKKKHDKIFMLAKSKFNSIKSLVSKALIDMEISHEEFNTILKEKDKYEEIKENLRNINNELKEKQENMRLNSVNSREILE